MRDPSVYRCPALSTGARDRETTTNCVGDAERGERNVSLRSIWQLADGLGIPASELLREAEKQEADGRQG